MEQWHGRVRRLERERKDRKVSAWYESGQKPKAHYKRWVIVAIAVIVIIVYLRS